MPDMQHEAASRVVNAWFGGDPRETLCSRLWRERWRRPWLWLLIWRIDHEASTRFDEPPGHCRRAAETHRLNAAPPDERVRLMEGETW